MEDLSTELGLKFNYKVTVEFEMLGTQVYRFIEDPSENGVLRDLIKRGYDVTIESIDEEIGA